MKKAEELEIEMEDVSEDTTLVDIDSADAKNPLKVVDYVEEIYGTYKNIEVLFSSYNVQSSLILQFWECCGV